MDKSRIPPSFILSGESNDEEIKQVNQMILCLQGKVLSCKNDQFVNHCSHIVCFSFVSTVKIMAGLASGKWLVEKNYILDSYKAGKWLAEEPYEVKDHKEVAKFRRCQARTLYAGSLLYIETQNSSITKSLIRVLIAGGATVYNKSEVIDENMRVDFALSDAHSLNSVIDVVGSSIPILKLDFVKHTVFFKHNPKDLKKFLLNPDTCKLPNISCVNEERLSVVASILRPEQNQSPAKSRVRRRMQTPSLPKGYCYPSVASYFLKKEGVTPVAGDTPLEQKAKKVDYCYTEDDVKFIEEVKNPKPPDADCIVVDDAEMKDGGKDSAIIDTSVPSTSLKRTSDGGIVVLAEAPPVTAHQTPNLSIDAETSESNSVLQEMDTNTNESKLIRTTDVKTVPPSDSSLVSDSSNTKTDIEKVPNSKDTMSTFIHNRDRLLKAGRAAVSIDRPRIRGIACKFVIELNTSHHYLSSTHIPVYSYPTSFKRVHELEAKECLYAGNVGQGELLITEKKIGRHKINVVAERPKSEELVEKEDCDVALESLEWLQIRLRTDVVPNVYSVASMINNHIIKCSFREVSSRALSILGSLLHLHPPCNKQMRDFYITVFQKVASTSGVSVSPQNQKGWEFVRIVANDLLSAPSRVYDASALMDFITQVLELDLVHYNEKPITVTALVPYRLFWPDRNQNPSVGNARVKDAIALWVESANAAPRHRRKIAKLISLLLEMVWKWSEVINPFALAAWPLPKSWEAIANEIILQFKAVEDPNTLPILVQSLRVPWQQILVASLAFRSSHSFYAAFKLSLPSLKTSFEKEVKLCKTGEDQCEPSCAPHSIRVHFLSLMYTLYAHAMGVHYTKAELSRQFILTLKKENVLHTYAPPPQHEGEGAKRRKIAMSVPTDKDSPEEDAVGEMESNPAIEQMVTQLSASFMEMNPFRKEIRALKGDCLHMTQCQFPMDL